MNTRLIVGGAALAMFVVEIVATFVEAPLAAVLGILFLLGAAWLWIRRDSIWPVVVLSVLFLLELVYLSDYDWRDTTDRLMMIATTAVCVVGLLAAVAWFVQRRRSTAS